MCVVDGDNIKSLDVISEQTLLGYATAAEAWFKLHFEISVPLYISRGGRQAELHPFIAEVVRQRRAWRIPQQKKEPISQEMYEWLHQHVLALCRDNAAAVLDQAAAVFDWLRLGLFPGSHLSEYGQSHLEHGERFATIPLVKEAGDWAGMPLAFVAADFTFYDRNQCLLSFEDALAGLAVEVHIRFRYDKSKENFTIRKFRRQRGCFLCPVKAALSIVDRARRLRVPASEPLGVYRSGAKKGSYRFLKGEQIVRVLRQACRAAPPNPDHYLRRHISRLVTHSNRVTAAVALFNAGVVIEDIAFRLRWNSDAIRFYLRDCFRTIGLLTERAVLGAVTSR